MNVESKEEIKAIFSDYKVHIDEGFTDNNELKWVLNNIETHKSFEKPDAYLLSKDNVYAIEHFQISQYKQCKGSDSSRVAKGSKENRNKMRIDRDFDLKPSIDNLITALIKNLKSHAKSFESYNSNVMGVDSCQNKQYRLIILIEDSTESAYIVRNRDTRAINPLQLKQIVECILEYQNDVWAVLYSYGNEVDKVLTGCTIKELEENANNLCFDVNDYVPFESDRAVHISKDNSKNDCNTVTIRLFDNM